jgi:hypothetical protein
MMISYLIQDSVLEETGFGIYAVNGPNYELGDMTVIVDLLHKTVYEHGSDVKVNWASFVAAYAPSLVEQI